MMRMITKMRTMRMIMKMRMRTCSSISESKFSLSSNSRSIRWKSIRASAFAQHFCSSKGYTNLPLRLNPKYKTLNFNEFHESKVFKIEAMLWENEVLKWMFPQHPLERLDQSNFCCPVRFVATKLQHDLSPNKNMQHRGFYSRCFHWRKKCSIFACFIIVQIGCREENGWDCWNSWNSGKWRVDIPKSWTPLIHSH